jgi:hypothetical protein
VKSKSFLFVSLLDRALLEAQAAYPDTTMIELKSLIDETFSVLNLMRRR